MKARIAPALLLLILSLALFASAACGGSDIGQSANVAPTPNTNPEGGAAARAASPAAAPTVQNSRGREADTNKNSNNEKDKGKNKDADKNKEETTPTPEEPQKDDSKKEGANKKAGELEGELNALKQRVDKLPADNGMLAGSLGFWLAMTPGILGLLGLGALGYYMMRLKGKIDLAKKRFDALSDSVDRTRESIATNKDSTERLEANLGKWKEEVVNELETLDGNHQKLVYDLQQQQLNATGGRAAATAPAPPPVVSDGQDAPFAFPCSAADYLKYLRRKGVPTVDTVADLVRGDNLIGNPEGQFLLVQDSNNQQRAYPVVPKITHFNTSQDFMYYRVYFTCDDLSSGDVWIREPAYVVEDSGVGGWRLKSMGRLYVR